MPSDIPVNIHLNAVNGIGDSITSIRQQLGGLTGVTKEFNNTSNQQSFFSQSTMALMAGTGQMIQSLGGKMAGFTNQIRMSRAATETARNGLASMGTSVDDLNKMEGTARKVGEQFGIMKSDILDAAYALKGGMSYVSSETLNDLMGLGVQLGAATKATSNTVSNMLANAGNTIGASLQGDAKAFREFQYQFANSSAAVVNIGKAEGDQVAAFTKNVGSGLLDMGQGLAEQQALATVLITTAGSGERAATMVTSGLTKKWDVYMKGLERVGIRTKNANGSIRSMIPIMAELKEKTAGMGELEQLDLYKKIFGSAKTGNIDQYTLKSVKALVNNSDMLTNTYKEMQKAVEDGTKAARNEIQLTDTMMGKMAKSFQQGPAFTMEQMKVKQQNLMEEMATNIKSSTSPLITLKAKFLDFAQSITSKNPQLVGSFLGMTEMIGNTVSGFGGFMNQIGGIGRGVSSLKLFKDTMGSIFGGKKKQNLELGLNSSGQMKVNTITTNTINEKTSPLKSLAGGEDPLTKSAKKFDWGKVGKGIMTGLGIAGAIGAILLPFAMKDKTLGPQIQSMMKEFQTLIGGALKELVTAFKPFIPMLRQTFMGVLKALMPIVPILLESIKPLIPILVDIIKMVADVIVPILPPVFNLIGTVLKAIMPLVPMLLNVVKMVVPILLNLVKALMPITNVMLKWNMKVLEFALNTISVIIQGIYKAILLLVPESAQTNDMKVQKYMMLSQSRTQAGDKRGAADALRQALAYNAENMFGQEIGKTITYDNIDQKMSDMGLSAVFENMINNAADYNKMDMFTASDQLMKDAAYASKNQMWSENTNQMVDLSKGSALGNNMIYKTTVDTAKLNDEYIQQSNGDNNLFNGFGLFRSQSATEINARKGEARDKLMLSGAAFKYGGQAPNPNFNPTNNITINVPPGADPNKIAPVVAQEVDKANRSYADWNASFKRDAQRSL